MLKCSDQYIRCMPTPQEQRGPLAQTTPPGVWPWGRPWPPPACLSRRAAPLHQGLPLAPPHPRGLGGLWVPLVMLMLATTPPLLALGKLPSPPQTCSSRYHSSCSFACLLVNLLFCLFACSHSHPLTHLPTHLQSPTHPHTHPNGLASSQPFGWHRVMNPGRS